ncbi:MAG: hypothetical protein WC829_20145, partial [Hyphomicrobium sp.]
MKAREHVQELERVPSTPIALFDETGELHGWSPLFADACALTAAELQDKRVENLWRELNAAKWHEIWSQIQTDGQNLTIHVLDRITKGAGDVVELEIGPFVFEGTTLAKIVI